MFKDPGGLTDYIAGEYIPDFLGGPYEVIQELKHVHNRVINLSLSSKTGLTIFCL